MAVEYEIFEWESSEERGVGRYSSGSTEDCEEGFEFEEDWRGRYWVVGSWAGVGGFSV